MRFKPSETTGFLAPPTLDDLIQRYAVYKSELDNYKKLSEEDNLEIKRLMVEANITEYTAGGYIAKYVVSTSESMDGIYLHQRLRTYLLNYGANKCSKFRNKRFTR